MLTGLSNPVSLSSLMNCSCLEVSMACTSLSLISSQLCYNLWFVTCILQLEYLQKCRKYSLWLASTNDLSVFLFSWVAALVSCKFVLPLMFYKLHKQVLQCRRPQCTNLASVCFWNPSLLTLMEKLSRFCNKTFWKLN